MFDALADTRAKFDLPLELFDDLLSAFRQDVTTHALRHLGRGARLLPPIGQSRRAARAAARRPSIGDEADRWSDAVCTALQLTNFWQDLAIDWERGRLYVPREVWAAAGADPADLDRRVMSRRHGSRPSATRRPSTRATLFDEGRPVCDVGSAAGCATSCARPGSAACASSTGWSAVDFDVFRPSPDA